MGYLLVILENGGLKIQNVGLTIFNQWKTIHSGFGYVWKNTNTSKKMALVWISCGFSGIYIYIYPQQLGLPSGNLAWLGNPELNGCFYSSGQKIGK